jgi:4-hydroxy-tetrahydrodipicolinate reductase
MADDVKVAIAGCAGRMGQLLVREVFAVPGVTVVGGSEAPGSPAAGRKIGDVVGIPEIDLPIVADAAALFDQADVVVDFTVPAASVRHAGIAAQKRKALLIGTTGLSAADRAAIADAAKTAPILLSANMSLGVNLLLALVEDAARRLGPDFDIEIVELHHRNKVDAPSGTALALGEAAARGRGVDLATSSIRSRDGHTGVRPKGAIGFATLRGGGAAGDHAVMFLGDTEHIELRHHARERRIFAQGAVRAAMWLKGKPAGLYGMKDVLGL